MKNWMLWLLIALAILPMVIPVWRRYQVVRHRLTAAPWAWNIVPSPLSFKKNRSPYLPIPRNTTALQLKRQGISKIWLVLAIFNLITIPVLTVLAGLVYDRIVIDRISPPVYSIFIRPAATLRHAEFVISPAYGFQMTIDGMILFSFGFQDPDRYYATRQQNDQWNSEDRPRLVASYIGMPQGLDRYDLGITNIGKGDATNIKITTVTLDLNRTRRTLATTPLNLQFRLKPGMVYPVATEPEKALQYLVICMAYSNEGGTAFVDPPQFYYTPSYMKSKETRSELARVTPLLYEELSAGFYCRNV
jgi:hypothetical protein